MASCRQTVFSQTIPARRIATSKQCNNNMIAFRVLFVIDSFINQSIISTLLERLEKSLYSIAAEIDRTQRRSDISFLPYSFLFYSYVRFM